VFEEIERDIYELLESHTAYSISKESSIPYQTVQDLKNGKSDIENARYRNVKILYEYAQKIKDLSE